MTTITDRITGLSSGLAVKAPVKVATTANITLNGLQDIDGVTVVEGDRVLVKNQTTGAENGIYNATTSDWQRAKDFDGIGDAVQGTLIPVAQGTVSAGIIYEVTTATFTIGTTALVFSATADTTVGAYVAEIQIVADNIADINTVAGISADVTTVVSMASNIQGVVANIVDIQNAEENAVIAAAAAITATAQAAKLTGTSVTSIAIGTGSKVFTTQADKDFNGNNVRVYSDANSANYMDGLASYSGTTLTVNVSAIGGSGTFTDWTIRVNGARGAAGTAGNLADDDYGDVSVSGSGTVMTLQPDAISGKAAGTPVATDVFVFERGGALFKTALSAIIAIIVGAARNFTGAQTQTNVTLTDGSTITPDFSLGNNFNVVLGGNRTLGMPSNIVAAQSFNIDFIQDATGSRTLGYAWCYHFNGGTAPTLSTAGGSTDTLYGDVKVYKQSAVTVSIATPGIITYNTHGLVTGQRVQLTTTGALPTGLTASTSYYVIVIDADSFWLATSLVNAVAGTKIATSGSQSGVHTLTACRINASLGIKGAA